MRISRVEVTNFRAISKASLELHPLTSLIGSNNAGKSSFLKAIDLFFSNSPKFDKDDFHNNNIEEAIEITISFSELTPEESALFENNLIDDSLTVTRQLLFGSGRESGNYFVEAMVNPEFMDCRNEQVKTERREKYKELQKRFELPSVRSADEIDDQLEKWESAHPEALKKSRVGTFRGWKNVAAGQLKRKTDFVFVPAVRDASEDTGATRSPAKQLIDTLAKQTIENNKAYQEFITEANNQLKQFTDPDNVPALAEFSSKLSEILQVYYSESEIIATWQPIEQLPVVFPNSELSVKDHGFISRVEKVGHGLQRAIIITILEFLAKERFKQPEEEFTSAQSDIILAIEEPEIYQHPIKQRHISAVLERLSGSFSKQTRIRLQIITATHSPLFVHLPRFEEVRIVRRAETAPHHVLISQLSISDCSAALAGFHRPPRTPLSESSFAAKLHIFNSEVSEGFFARKVVLVEGASDKAILEASYLNTKRSPLSEGICIIDAGGKKKIDKPAYVFKKLGIPVFVIMDNDRSSTKEPKQQDEINYNRLIQRILGFREEDIEDWPEKLNANFCAWDGNLEKYIVRKCGQDCYDDSRNQVKISFEVDSDDCVKSPTLASALFSIALSKGHTFNELNEIITAIDNL
ncbi:AAA family ATPase [Rhodoplanes roseus]|uniref:Uncharacterized protein n=1 Tax=Rhodoplanes roseus TaxID=29409 RepID=A0A327KX51_9BRAD|nr:ATP-dependent endonuclease [Rhodoplanes roseus]RAI42666.1 hypothetical protein CH341_18370 [Rhodoplanes roseus]